MSLARLHAATRRRREGAGRVPTGGALALVLLATACGAFTETRHHMSMLTGAVWADDDTALLVCRYEFDHVDERFYFAAFEKGYRRENEQTFLEARPRRGPAEVVAVLPGNACWSGASLYFMRSAGYVVVYDLQVPLDGGQPRRIGVKRWDLVGGLLLPSWDGRLIAVLSHPNHGAQRSAGLEPAAHVTFVDARDGRVVAGPHRLRSANPTLAWTPRGELIATGSVRVELDGRLVPVARPCFDPPTSSGRVSRSGEVATVSQGELSISRSGEPPGCRSAVEEKTDRPRSGR